jgi:hypothetical protein
MADDFKGLNKETLGTAIGIQNSMKEIGIATQSIEAKLRTSSSHLSNIRQDYLSIGTAANRVVKLQNEAAKSSKATSEAIKEQNKQLNIVKNLNIQIDILYAASANSTGKTRDNLLKQAQNVSAARDNASKLADVFEDIANDSSKLDKSTKFFGNISKIASDIPILRKFSEPFEKAAEAARQQVLSNAETGKNTSVLLTGLKALGGSFSWITLALTTAKLFLDALIGADKRVTDIAKNLSISKDAADGIYTNLKGFKDNLNSSLQSTQKIVDAFNELSQLTEFSTIATKNQVDAQITLTKQIGISTEAALGFQETLAVSNIDAEKGIDIITNQISAFANQNKVVADGRKIFEQISKTSKLIQLNFRGNLDSLVKSTLQANKLGLSLDQVNKIGESLLDFESSISSELEAELLTGKQLNLEQARLYALNNDIAGLTQEIANQGINAANFASMNRIQQEAIAKTLGMSANELGDSLYKQELINKTAGNFTKELRNQAEQLKKSNNTQDIAKGIALEKRALAIENGILQGKEIKDAITQVDVQTSFNDALEQAQELFSDLASGGYLDSLVNGFKDMITFARSLGNILDVLLVKPLNIIANTLSGIIKIAAGLTSLDFSLIKAGQNDLMFAGANMLDMGINTAVAAGITDKENKNLFTKPMIVADEASKTKETSAKDFVIKTLPEDTVVGMGGTSLGRTEEMVGLLKELLTTVKAGGSVYLDSNKVGTAMAMGTYKTT